MKQPGPKAMACAIAILKDLNGRKGFDHIIDSLEPDIQADMTLEHAQIVQAFLVSGDTSA